MATGKDRQRELARRHYERQMARRAERMAKARRRRIIGSVLGVVVVGAVVATSVVVSGSGDVTSAQTGAQASPSAAPEPKPFDPATRTCGYVADSSGQVKDVGLPPAQADPDTPRTMTLTTNHGKIEIKLEPAKAPCTVNSFVHLASKDYFDGTKCHRLTTGGLHVLQCGDPLAKADGETETDGTGGPGYRIADENLGGMEYKRGVVAMANSGPNTGGSQFFIVYGDDTNNLAPNYTPFGTVTKGMSIVDKVAKAGVKGGGGDGAPKLAVELKDVTISGKS
ncbi:peptidyl-prolyl cis-trans isomerase [Thermopolyspora flexuosa]|uniref:Peptidyl-prolyl cis-trans isomerase n=1 Tax=Thermopolyspora flexuosa TaxID=103836 RepID=A0A543IXC5_9ACTN|nr:peptidylprolyl isomerase [Thermopolyspora flexuosa]TQM75220.1 peptidyl-prolyl cis-trans isomerase B (cyclophilin B) [Thermopolyspora flexuosa]GGM91410.1 peptidyl-prolyl cis-trans isomerase [Thermopolyspora flexuosa]